MMGSMPLLRLENVTRSFDDGMVVALRDINLSIHLNDCMAIVGSSGSGKSSLLHILGGCDQCTSGSVYWCEKEILDQGYWRLLRATEIGLVFQEFHLFPALTAIESVEMALLGNGITAQQRHGYAASLLMKVGLEARMNHLPTALSGGERQRVAIARSIANKPRLLLGDEPTGNLDSVNAASFANMLFELQKLENMALVLVTHDERLALRCKRRVTIRDGRIVGDERDPHKFARANWGAWSIDQSNGGLAPEVGDLLEKTVDQL